MNDEPRNKSARLARTLRWRQYLLVVLPILLTIVVTLGSVTYLKVQEGRYLAVIKNDYQKTWCKTYGVDVYTSQSTNEWEAFIGRHREFLDSLENLHYPDYLTGQRLFGLEIALKSDEFSRDSEYASQYAADVFSVVHDELAIGKNEFGKSVPLPCDGK